MRELLVGNGALAYKSASDVMDEKEVCRRSNRTVREAFK